MGFFRGTYVNPEIDTMALLHLAAWEIPADGYGDFLMEAHAGTTTLPIRHLAVNVQDLVGFPPHLKLLGLVFRDLRCLRRLDLFTFPGNPLWPDRAGRCL
jgi:hypothetical protein